MQKLTVSVKMQHISFEMQTDICQVHGRCLTCICFCLFTAGSDLLATRDLPIPCSLPNEACVFLPSGMFHVQILIRQRSSPWNIVGSDVSVSEQMSYAYCSSLTSPMLHHLLVLVLCVVPFGVEAHQVDNVGLSDSNGHDRLELCVPDGPGKLIQDVAPVCILETWWWLSLTLWKPLCNMLRRTS